MQLYLFSKYIKILLYIKYYIDTIIFVLKIYKNIAIYHIIYYLSYIT